MKILIKLKLNLLEKQKKISNERRATQNKDIVELEQKI